MASTAMDGERESHQLTVVLSGGISLGAFHAGAVAQVGWFLAEWSELRNKHPSLPAISVDVVSGASAGAMTGAMLAHFIGSNYYATKLGESAVGSSRKIEDRSREFVQANFDTWCGEGLDILKLMAEDEGRPRTSFLSNKALEDIAAKSLCDIDPALPEGQDSLIYVCTLTSMTGIPRVLRLPDVTKTRDADGRRPAFDLNYKSRRDSTTFLTLRSKAIPSSFREDRRYVYDTYESGDVVFVEQGSGIANQVGHPKERLWGRFRGAALSSGAFPFAWNPMVTARTLGQYGGSETSFGRFKYMDGGVIDNMPLARGAIAIREYSLKSSVSNLTAERTYILIGTQPLTKHEENFEPADVREKSATWRDEAFPLQDVVMPMFEAMREQTFIDDLSTAISINRALEDRERNVWPAIDRYVDDLPAEKVDLESGLLRSAVDAAVAKLMDKPRVTREDWPEEHFYVQTLDAEQQILDKERIQRTLDLTYGRIVQEDVLEAMGSGNQEDSRNAKARESLKADMKIAFDYWYDLLGKHRLAVLPVNPRAELQGQFLGAFGGFMDRRFMIGDFGHGMERARLKLHDYVRELLGGGVLPVDVEDVFRRSEDVKHSVLSSIEDQTLASVVEKDAFTYYQLPPSEAGRKKEDIDEGRLETVQSVAIDRGLAAGALLFPDSLAKNRGKIEWVLRITRAFAWCVVAVLFVWFGLSWLAIFVATEAIDGVVPLRLTLFGLLFGLFLVALMLAGTLTTLWKLLTPERMTLFEKLLAGLPNRT